MQDVVEMKQLFPFAFHQPGNRNPGPAFDNAGNFLVGHLIAEKGGVAAAFFCQRFFRFQFLLKRRKPPVFQFCGLVEVVFPLRLFNIGIDLLDFFPKLLHL